MPFFPAIIEHSFDITHHQLNLVRWISFYESLYELDEVERPPERMIENDEELDIWYERYRAKVKKKLVEYHKNDPEIDRGMPKPGKVMGIGDNG